MYRRTFAEINLDHLAHNIRVLQTSFPDAPFLCPMVKANAYGHGDVQLARFLETLGIKHLGVCLIEEGLLLRHFGVKAEILVFRGFDREGAEKIIQYRMTPVVTTWEQIDHLEEVAKSPVNIHLKFDTGMNRLGFRPEEAQKLYERLWQNKKIRVKALVTHLYNGEDAISDQGNSADQLRRLHQASEIFKPFEIFSHALNSAGILNLLKLRKEHKAEHPLLLQNWGLRPGLMIYGYNPVPGVNCDLKPVMSLKSVVNTFRHLKAGETVSYGGTWKAKQDSVIAVVPIGYADGYHRILSNQSHALFNGVRVPLVGNICMDYLMLDVTEAVRGKDLVQYKDQEVVLFGQDSFGNFLSPEELAGKAKSITWEMLTSVGERVPRVYTGADASFVIENVGGE
ncbi:alanine racemase [Bdellovibrio svalbardensis]|uniref:Alanine racemase n=1 Tax=Bdellovibrio svalbardensis TaxID=2972972 RepID=A0ABT6DGH6_9BACT|nr:alanine racemase [Bdellovibrio svalbardensis]MDG0815604.1 alanine racemase [Bdellovibrio svalbardensis]